MHHHDETTTSQHLPVDEIPAATRLVASHDLGNRPSHPTLHVVAEVRTGTIVGWKLFRRPLKSGCTPLPEED